MARRNISLPDELDQQARRAKLNLSALTQQAVTEELHRRRRLGGLDAWLDRLDDDLGEPSVDARISAEEWFALLTPVVSGPPVAARSEQRSSSRRATG